MHADTATVITKFNDAFQTHDPTDIADLVGADCVLENSSPAPDGERFEGHAACSGIWGRLAADPAISFDLEAVTVAGDRATVLWRLRFEEGDEGSVRGVNLMQVRDGKIVEALGYVKGN
jgi:ketosteroid isomerase-like protein